MTSTRITNQRLKTLEYLNSVRTHPNAETIYNAVKKMLPTITLATVYRNLNRLAEQGEILRLEINSEYRYDADISFHQHCICRECDSVSDIFQKEISKYALKKFSSDSFEPNSVNVIFYGICKKCKRIAK